MHDGFGSLIAKAQAAAGDHFAPVEALAWLGDIPTARLAAQPEKFDHEAEDEQRSHGQHHYLLPVHMWTENAVYPRDDVLHGRLFAFGFFFDKESSGREKSFLTDDDRT